MKKTILIFLALIASTVMAGVEDPFVQFAPNDYCVPDIYRADQNWFGAQLIRMDVKANSNVWLSNYVRSWYEPIADLHMNIYDMSANKYGYIVADDINGLGQSKESYQDLIHWANGTTTDITYYYDLNPAVTNTATGYLLDHFDSDAEIYLVMTTIPSDGGETVDSYQYVQDPERSDLPDYDTSLVSRQHNTVDLAGNVRVNFGIDSETVGLIGREFVAVYDATDDGGSGGGASGQPLPGLFTSCLLAIGAVGGASRLRRKKN